MFTRGTRIGLWLWAVLIVAFLWLLYLAWMIPMLMVLEGRARATGALLPFVYVAAPAAVTLLLLSVLFVQALLGRRWVRQHGCGGVEHGRLLWASTAKRGPWARPQMARLLQMDAPAVPATPQGCLHAMIAMAGWRVRPCWLRQLPMSSACLVRPTCSMSANLPAASARR